MEKTEAYRTGKYQGLCAVLDFLGIDVCQWDDLKKGKAEIQIKPLRKKKEIDETKLRNIY